MWSIITIMRVLGIDPGTNVMGFGVIRIVGAKIEMMDMGILSKWREWRM